MEYKTHEERKNILRQKIKSDYILPLPFSRLTTLIKQMENVMHDMNMDYISMYMFPISANRKMHTMNMSWSLAKVVFSQFLRMSLNF